MDEDIYPAIVNPGVYPPSEDTYILMDTIETCPNDDMLDMGCGSGYISINYATKVRSIIALDIHFDAVMNTRENLMRYGMMNTSQIVQSDLFAALSPSRRFSIVSFNPPYLPQDNDHTSLDPALVGGETGTEVSERFILQCIEHLMELGKIYLVASNLSNIGYLKEVMEANGLEVSVAAEEPLFFEKLVVLKGVKQK